MSYVEIQNLLSEYKSIKAIRAKVGRLGLSESRAWSKEEIEILKNNYSIKPSYEVLKLLPNRTASSICDMAAKLNIISYYYLNSRYNNEEIEYIKTHYNTMSDLEMAKHLNRSESGVHQKMIQLSLFREKEYNGYDDWASFVRGGIKAWSNSIKAKYNYTCQLSGERSNIIVHHILGFNIILSEALDVCNIDLNISHEKYDSKTHIDVLNTYIELQEKYNEYIVITEKLHKLFHSIYGYGYNTKEQFDEFTTNYKLGKYKELL